MSTSISSLTNSKTYRNYSATPTQEQIDCVHAIIRALPTVNAVYDEGWIAYGKLFKDLIVKGAKIKKLHPLTFLKIICANDITRVAMSNIQHDTLAGRKFYSNLSKSLKTAAINQNLMPHVQDFAAHLKIQSSAIGPSIKSCDADQLVGQLVKLVSQQHNITTTS